MLLLLFRCFFVVALGVGALVVQSIRCVLSTPPCDAHLFSGIEHGRGLASFTEFFFCCCSSQTPTRFDGTLSATFHRLDQIDKIEKGAFHTQQQCRILMIP